MTEYEYSGEDGLCPVVWASWGYWVIVMPRCRPVTSDEYEAQIDFEDLRLRIKGNANGLEEKWDSFGVLPNGRVVAVDYGVFC